MANPIRISPNRAAPERWIPPLPHPSWRGEAIAADFARPFRASEFWQRLGL